MAIGHNEGYKLGDEIEKEIGDKLKKTQSRNIYNMIKEWTSAKIAPAKRRWIFELIQNAIDTATARQEDAKNTSNPPNLTIEIHTYETEKRIERLTFMHNGGYFTPEEIGSIIYGGSTRPLMYREEEPKYIGRFGTGFLVTHVISRKVDVEGLCLSKGTKKTHKFKLTINREIDGKDPEDAILNNIYECISQLNRIENEETHSECPWTKYTYHITDGLGDQAAREGIEILTRCIPFLFAFNPILNEINIKRKKINGENINEERYSREEHTRSIIKWSNEDPKVEIAIRVENNEILSLEGIPKIFVGQPLIETENYLHIPFVINSRLFEPSEERDSLLFPQNENDQSINEILLRTAFEIYSKNLSELMKNQALRDTFRSVQFKLVDEYKTKQNSFWGKINEYLKNTVENIVNNVPTVNTINERKKICEAIFLDYGKWLEKSKRKEELFKKFYHLSSSIYSNIPREDEILGWREVCHNLQGIVKNNIRFVSIGDIVEEIASLVKDKVRGFSTPHVEFNKLNEKYQKNSLDPKKFLLDLYEILDDLYNEKIIQNEEVKYLIPTQGEAISPHQWEAREQRSAKIYFENMEEKIPDELKGLIKSVGWDIYYSLLHPDFAKYSILRDLLYPTNIEDISRIVIDEHFPQNTEEDAQKWIPLFKWYIKNNKIPDGFPIFTKDKKIQKYSEKESKRFLLPFKYINNSITDYEEIWPDDCILDSIYFETSEGEEILSLLKEKKWKVAVTALVEYKKDAEISNEELKCIVSNEETGGKDHHIQSDDENISDIPFLDRVLGKIKTTETGKKVNEGKMFFKFIIEYLIQEDKKWMEKITVRCSCKKTHEIIPALWLAKIRTISWVPIEKKGGTVTDEDASKENIEKAFSMVIDEFLNKNSEYDDKCEKINKFLAYFGFDDLDLKIKILTIRKKEDPSKIKKDIATYLPLINKCSETQCSTNDALNLLEIYAKGKENGLDVEDLKNAVDLYLQCRKIDVKVGELPKYMQIIDFWSDKNHSEYSQLVEYCEKRKMRPSDILTRLKAEEKAREIREENKKIGLLVEKIVEYILLSNGFSPERMYIGGDFEVWPSEECWEGWDSGQLKLSHWVLEVKFTSGKYVHLSNKQAERASTEKENYVILVIENGHNLRNLLENIDINNINREDLVPVVAKNCRTIENIYEYFEYLNKCLEQMNPYREKVKPEIGGYRIHQQMWQNEKTIEEWIKTRIGSSELPNLPRVQITT